MNYESNRNVNQMQSHLCNESQMNYNLPRSLSPSLSLQMFCQRFVTGVRGTSKLGLVRDQLLVISQQKSTHVYRVFDILKQNCCLFLFFSVVFLFTIAIYGDISINQLFKSCSQIRKTRLNSNVLYKLQIACQIVNFGYCV